MLIATVVASVVAFLATGALIAVLRPLARRLGLVDRPEGRRTHAEPTPAIGGVAMVLPVAPLAFYALPLTPQMMGLSLAAVVILVAGIADDLFRIRWPYRFTAQLLAALLVILVGGIQIHSVGEIFGVPTRPLGPLAVPLTILTIVGVINAINMVDGVDGLAGTTTLVASLLIAIAAAYAGNARLASGLALMSGAICAFLLYNLRTPWNARARVFLGNAGSEILGLILACACIRLTQNQHHPVGIQVAPFLIAPAVLDCLTLMLRRARLGVSPFVGDRNHLHHLLLDAGMSPNGVVLVISGATFIIGSAALVALKGHVPPLAFTATFMAMWAGYFMATRRRERTVERFASLVGFRAAAGRRARLAEESVHSRLRRFLADAHGGRQPTLWKGDLAATPPADGVVGGLEGQALRALTDG